MFSDDDDDDDDELLTSLETVMIGGWSGCWDLRENLGQGHEHQHQICCNQGVILMNAKDYELIDRRNLHVF